MNSSTKAFIADMTALALVNPEYINESSEFNDIPDFNEAEYEEDYFLWQMMLDDAISRDDRDEIQSIRRSMQQLKTEKRMIKKLRQNNQTLKSMII